MENYSKMKLNLKVSKTVIYKNSFSKWLLRSVLFYQCTIFALIL